MDKTIHSKDRCCQTGIKKEKKENTGSNSMLSTGDRF